MQDWLVRLRFLRPAHFGEAGIGQEATATTVHSDTLYSAIWSVWARYGLGRGITSLLSSFLGEQVPFRLSSAFVFRESTCFLPRPMARTQVLEDLGKVVRGTRYLPAPLFRDWIEGRQVAATEIESGVERYRDSFKVTLRPRVELDRLTDRSGLYHSAQVTFRDDSGLFFVVRLYDEGLAAPLRAAVTALGEEGLGADRSTGLGSFRAEWEDISNEPVWSDILAPAEGPGPACLLSVCSPQQHELPYLQGRMAYEMDERHGWSQSASGLQALRLPVRMLTEGSVVGGPMQGRVLDVTPPGWVASVGHPVYRSGLALAVPVRGGEGQ